jgi:hypothetical protein
LLALCALTLACPEVIRTKTAFAPAAPGDPPRTLVLADGLRVVGQAGDGQRLPGGSTWKLVGAIEAGDVYKRADGPFIIDSNNSHEAHLVVANGRVVGFYLPGEGAFAPASQPVALPPQ